MRLLVHQTKARRLIDPPCRGQHVIGPQCDLPIAGGPCKLDAFPHQLCPDPMPAGTRINQENAQLRRALFTSHTEDAPDRLTVKLRNPCGRPTRNMAAGVVYDDLHDECLEGRIPAFGTPRNTRSDFRQRKRDRSRYAHIVNKLNTPLEPYQTHTPIDPAILYWGTPVVLISTTNPDGTPNLAPMSSAFWMGRSAVLGLGLSSHTAQNILRTRECVLNLPSIDQVEMVDRLALTTGAQEVHPWKQAAGYRHHAEKFELAGATPVPSDTVGAPRIQETPVAMEATLVADYISDMHLLTMHVQRVHVHETIRLGSHANRIDPDRWRPLIMSFQNYYGLGDQVLPSKLATIPEDHYR